jgi:large subunit ribosomal protein L4
MRRTALRSALSVKAADQQIVVVDEFSISEPKTRLMAKALESLVGESSALILIPEKSASYDVITRSARNISSAKLLMANYLNIRDLFGYEKVILPVAALDVIVSYLG